ncbi:hypothetical protein PG994_013292 [Apiospora phragmitis]|uniref:Uncharacterized protein n=1 Tax=Apiospora phragmitis TaxID=2905665 RepID=A0ABR1T876_9PEZI
MEALLDGTSTFISVTKEDIRRANQTDENLFWLNSTVQYDQANGGGYMGSLELFHQIHCLVISCHADTGLITYHWVKDNPVPYPEFNTWHQCKNLEEDLAWSKAREAYHTRVKKEMFENLVEMPYSP